jgi:hypothetical protein
MFRNQFQRLYELRDLVEDPTSSNAYFQNFDELLESSEHVRSVYARWEHVLQVLNADAWEMLKIEAAPHVLSSEPKYRGWQALFDCLNEANAYRYLVKIGCSRVAFIPRTTKQTPDLEGWLEGQQILCEVKTINISDEEVHARCSSVVTSIAIRLEPGFFNKLSADISKASLQLAEYDSEKRARHLIYISPHFDDFLAQCKETYFEQIDAFVAERQFTGVELVFHNAHTPFHMPIRMNAAVVDNDS